MRINPINERLKREYFTFKKEADGKDAKTIDAIAKAIWRFEEYNSFKDFSTFNRHQAINFKNHIAKANNKKTGAPMALATQHSSLNMVQTFFRWLAFQRGYKKKIHIPDIDYLNLSTNDARAAKSSAPVDFPSIEQMRHTIAQMPHTNEIEMRDRAIIAFAILTAARVGAIASLKIKDFDHTRNLISQNPKHVDTKFKKRIETFLMVIDDKHQKIFLDWVNYLKTEKLYGPSDPLFPKTQNGHDENKYFKALGISKEHWTCTTAIRDIFKKAFENAGIKYYNPHSLRNTLTHHYQSVCKTPEEFKAISQNLGHENVLTTFTSYGEIQTQRQGEIVKNLVRGSADRDIAAKLREIADSL